MIDRVLRSFIQLIIQQWFLLSIYCVPGSQTTAASKTDKNPKLLELLFWWRETNNKANKQQNDKIVKELCRELSQGVK